MKQTANYKQEEWLRMLDKGMVTIPKLWRKDLALKKGSIIKAKKTANGVILKPMAQPASYRVYTKAELNRFLQNDRLTISRLKKLKGKLGKSDG